MKKFLFTLLLLLTFLLPSKALAANDLVIECNGGGSCSSTPSLPIFDDSGLYPGQIITSQVVVKNTSSYTGDFAFQINNLSSSDVSQVIDFVISDDLAGTSAVYGPVQLSTLDGSYVMLNNFTALEERTYYFHAIFDSTAGNEYQNLNSSFDLVLGFEFVKDTPSGTVAGATTSDRSFSPARAPQCDNENLFAAGPANFQLLGQTNNSMTLSWSPVDQASGYAIFFTRADGEAYSVLPSMIPSGATQYTINNLAAANYSVEIVAVGGNEDLCSSPRSSLVVSVVGPLVIGRPVTQEGDVLGKEIDENGVENFVEEGDKVLGAADSCQNSKKYLFSLLILQFILVGVVYFIYRSKKTWSKQLVVFGLTALSIMIFYWQRDCDCLDSYWWLSFMCQWYLLVSIIESLILQLINYYLIEE